MGSYGSYEGQYRDGNLKTVPLDWVLFAAFLLVGGVALLLLLTWKNFWEPLPFWMNGLFVAEFILGGLCTIRYFSGIPWRWLGYITGFIISLAAVILLATIDAHVVFLGLLVIIALLALLFRRQIKRKLPSLLYELALKDEG